MFSVKRVVTPKGELQFRDENPTGLRCRISPDRLKRQIDQALLVPSTSDGCPFCPGTVLTVTPTFPDGSRIQFGESVTFPNLYPFGEGHVVTVITKDHFVEKFSRQQIVDALHGQMTALLPVGGYASINWNYLPSAGASLLHPHMQGLADSRPPAIVERYLSAGQKYRSEYGRSYWDAVRD
jgi:UDPglucose--hexose-1-phosphate uridylyltransferase